MIDESKTTPRIIIAGAGMSGLCLGIQLKRSGFTSFRIFEKSSEVGGTWLDNHYPNSGCDVPSYLYSFSFGPPYDWSQKYARQPEILDYFKTCADHFGIRPSIQFQTTVDQARFDESEQLWKITTSDGKTHEAEIFVSAIGQLNRPRIPDFEGLSSYQGASWHSARWNHDVPLSGRDVAVVGNAASAIQFLPELARSARSLFVFQRTPNWVHPLRNYHYPRWARWLFRQVPGAAKMYRCKIFLESECRFAAFVRGVSIQNWFYRRWLVRKMKQAASPELQPLVIPNYPPGCKRILLSSDYLQTLDRDNVRLVTDPIQRFLPTGIATETETFPAEVVIFATGFDTSHFFQPIKIVGRHGISLEESWREYPKALLGLMAPGFPNLFMLYGPNTNLGHNSIIFMVECQVHYLLNCLKLLQKQRARTLEPKEEAVEAYNRKLQNKLRKSVWAGNCTSWYKTADGHILNNWCGTATNYWLHTRRVKPDWFEWQTERPPAVSSHVPARMVHGP